jgi:CO dehydrogenase/acetyl-CoA synthase beta subunit
VAWAVSPRRKALCGAAWSNAKAAIWTKPDQHRP